MEYRGYDSAGIAVEKNGKIVISKKKGKLSVLKEELKKNPISGTTGIAHTRWATHGVPNDVNAHPHTSGSSSIAIVHNGIIENYLELKKMLEKKGYKCKSNTDSEVIAHLIDIMYEGDLREAVQKAVKKLDGSYAIAVIHRNEPGRVIGARKDSPLIVGVGKEEAFVASDIPAVLEHTKKIIYLENNEIVDLFRKKCTVYGADGKKIKRTPTTIKWDISQAEKLGYKHFMLKEIFEQPSVLREIFKERVKRDKVVFDELEITKKELKKIKKIAIVACGTAYHAGMTGKYMIERYARIPTWVDNSSEFRYRDPLVDKETLVIAISQSGETADTLAGAKIAKERGAKILSICNVLESSLTRLSDGVVYTHAGPEIAVASTKAFTTQLTALFLFSLYLGMTATRTVSAKEAKRYLQALTEIPSLIQEILKKQDIILSIARKLKGYRNFLYLGRGLQFPIALEGALKLKEISYIHAEGYPAGEMKHGPIALISPEMPVVFLAPANRLREKIMSNMEEVRARDGQIISITTNGTHDIIEKSIASMEIPETIELLEPLLTTVPLQLLAYHIADLLGTDVDQPRNLAKSVTVE